MLVDIFKVEATDRIRKDFGDIEELASSIKEIGLLNPPVVTPEMKLIAGERRLRACKQLGWEQIEVRVMTVKDFEQQLRMEIDENENRKDFTFSERLDWARRLERVEREKARERMEAGKAVDPSQISDKGRADDVVAIDSGFGSRDTFRKAKFIGENADAETIAKLDAEKISIHKAWTETKAKLKEAEQKLREKDAELLRAQTPKVEIKEVVKEVIPADIQREYDEMKTEKKQLEQSLMRTYERIEQLEKIEKTVRTQEESPMYDLIRSLQTANRYFDTFTLNEKFTAKAIASAEQTTVDSLETQLRRTLAKANQVMAIIDERNGVVVIDETTKMEVIVNE